MSLSLGPQVEASVEELETHDSIWTRAYHYGYIAGATSHGFGRLFNYRLPSSCLSSLEGNWHITIKDRATNDYGVEFVTISLVRKQNELSQA